MGEPTSGQSAYIDKLYAMRDALLDQKISVIASGPAPTYNIDGHQVKWQEYLEYLDKSIATADEMIARAEVGFIVSRI